MDRLDPDATHDIDRLAAFRHGSAGRRGLALAAGFWVVITGLLAARVALFDEIAAAGLGGFVSTQLASLASIVLR